MATPTATVEAVSPTSKTPVVKDAPSKPALAQRAACDRCRGQKLRCPRTKPGSQTVCDRCQRIGAVCRTAPRLPSGRPSLRGTNRTNNRPNNKRRKSSLECQSPSMESAVSEAAAIVALPTPPSSATTFFSLVDNEKHTTQELPYDQASPFDLEGTCVFDDSPTTSLETFDSTLCYNLDFGTSTSDQHSATCLGSVFDVFEPDLSQLSHSSCYGSSSPGDNAMPLERSTHSSETASAHHSFVTPRPFIESISAISERISQLQSHHWLSAWDPAAVIDDSAPSTPRTASTSTDEDNFSYVNMVLTEFFVLSHLKGIQPASSPMRSFESTSRMNLSTLLMLLSAYVQIGQLMGSLLFRIGQKCQEMRTVSCDTSSNCPQIAEWQQNLYTKLQLLESHCTSMERDLCQSAHAPELEEDDLRSRIYCVSAESSSILIRTMTSQARDTFRTLGLEFDRIRCEILGI